MLRQAEGDNNLPHPLDHFAKSISIAVTNVLNDQVRKDHVLEAMHGLTGDVRDLEMMVSHYQRRTQEMSMTDVQNPNLAIRLRAVGASTAMQDAAMDLERRLESIKKHMQDLSMHLDL
jgi:hypothetical protein